VIHCKLGGRAPCIDDLCHGSSWTLCGLDMDFEEEMEHGQDLDDDDAEYWDDEAR
jgi:hypothetical protein